MPITYAKAQAKIVTLTGDASTLNADLSNGWQVSGFSVQGGGTQQVLLTKFEIDEPQPAVGFTR